MGKFFKRGRTPEGSSPPNGDRRGATRFRAAARRLRRDRGGNVTIIVALVMPVILIGMGTAVDMTLVYESKANLRQSLDAAALAAGRHYGTTQDANALRTLASSYFYANAGHDAFRDTKFNYDGVSTQNGRLVMRLSATRNEPTYFGSAIKYVTGNTLDFSKVAVAEFSEVVIENRSIEMALVFDNSGSMLSAPASGGASKISTLKTAAQLLVDQVMAANASSNVANPVAISVVPFSSAVNICATDAHANAEWMDTKGWSSVHHENFDWSTWTGGSFGAKAGPVPVPLTVPVRYAYKLKDALGLPTGDWVTRFYVLKNARRSSNNALRFTDGWGGCVQSRPGGLAFTDADANEMTPDSLFVPYFAPDEYNWSGTADTVSKNDYLKDENAPTGSSDAAVIARQTNMTKYLNSPNQTQADGERNTGPNFGCDTTAITPLNKTKATIKNAITALEAKGATNIPEGLAWGWRTLSRKAPFTEGKPNGAENNLKIIVLMTDGENTYNPTYSNGAAAEIPNANKSPFGTYGYGQRWENGTAKVGHIFDGLAMANKTANGARYVEGMNEMLTKVCTNAKNDGKVAGQTADGIVVFTIAFDLKDGTPVKTLLQNCASNGVDGNGPKLYYDAKSSTDLLTAFQSITGQISSLRVSR